MVNRLNRLLVSHPGPDDVLLLVEVAETSPAFDREVKVPRYADAGIPEVWLVDLAGERVEVYRQPAQGGYGHVDERGRGHQLTPQALPDVMLEVTDVLGEADPPRPPGRPNAQTLGAGSRARIPPHHCNGLVVTGRRRRRQPIRPFRQ